MRAYVTQTILALLVSSSSAFAVTGCGMTIAADERFIISSSGECSFEIMNHKNYAGLNGILILDGSTKIRIEDSSVTYTRGDERYFVFDEINDAKFTQKTIQNKPIVREEVNGMSTYIGNWIGFVQRVPEYGKRSNGYSLKIVCLSAIIGDNDHTLQARFCAPHNHDGDALVRRFKRLILKTRLSGAK